MSSTSSRVSERDSSQHHYGSRERRDRDRDRERDRYRSSRTTKEKVGFSKNKGENFPVIQELKVFSLVDGIQSISGQDQSLLRSA